MGLLHYRFDDYFSENLPDPEDVLKSTISTDTPAENDLNEIKKKLFDYFENDKPFLRKDLTLEELAEDLKSNRTYISKIINTEGITFYRFVNQYRIKYAVSLMKSNDISMNEIIENSGFKSRSSFYDLFKQIYGCSPGEYVKRLKS